MFQAVHMDGLSLTENELTNIFPASINRLFSFIYKLTLFFFCINPAPRSSQNIAIAWLWETGKGNHTQQLWVSSLYKSVGLIDFQLDTKDIENMRGEGGRGSRAWARERQAQRGPRSHRGCQSRTADLGRPSIDIKPPAWLLRRVCSLLLALRRRSELQMIPKWNLNILMKCFPHAAGLPLQADTESEKQNSMVKHREVHVTILASRHLFSFK